MWEWTEVENSSAIKRFGFKGETFRMQYKSGMLYQWDQVSPETHNMLKEAVEKGESIGKLCNKHIVGAYQSERLDSPDPDQKGSCEGCRLLAKMFDSMSFCLFLDDAVLSSREDKTVISVCRENRVDGGEEALTPEIKVIEDGCSGDSKNGEGRRVGSARCLRCTR